MAIRWRIPGRRAQTISGAISIPRATSRRTAGWTTNTLSRVPASWRLTSGWNCRSAIRHGTRLPLRRSGTISPPAERWYPTAGPRSAASTITSTAMERCRRAGWMMTPTTRMQMVSCRSAGHIWKIRMIPKRTMMKWNPATTMRIIIGTTFRVQERNMCLL